MSEYKATDEEFMDRCERQAIAEEKATRFFIQAFDGPWHIGERKELRTDKTGELLHTFVVAQCTHKQIGGPWGHRTWKHSDAPKPLCKRCQKILAKATGE